MGTQEPWVQVGLGGVLVPVEPPTGLLTVVVKVGTGVLQELVPGIEDVGEPPVVLLPVGCEDEEPVGSALLVADEVGWEELLGTEVVGSAVELLVGGCSVLLEVGSPVGVGVEVGVGVGVEVGSSHAGRAAADVGVSKRAISCLRRSTRPGATLPPALFHLGSSSATTVDGFWPPLRRSRSVDVRNCPQPTLKVKLTSAPYWLALSLTLWSTLASTQP